mmetsp:Transcript_22969/g.67663  ORF Transcript_22969/g.67663 Transcript_22969/m.67663 type:complete len:200 (-) Transcript_22969:2-601(-)
MVHLLSPEHRARSLEAPDVVIPEPSLARPALIKAVVDGRAVHGGGERGVGLLSWSRPTQIELGREFSLEAVPSQRHVCFCDWELANVARGRLEAWVLLLLSGESGVMLTQRVLHEAARHGSGLRKGCVRAGGIPLWFLQRQRLHELLPRLLGGRHESILAEDRRFKSTPVYFRLREPFPPSRHSARSVLGDRCLSSRSM